MPLGKDRLSKLKALEIDIEEMELVNDSIAGTGKDRGRRSSGTKEETTINADSPRSILSNSTQRSPVEMPKPSPSPRKSDMSVSDHEEVVGGAVTVKLEPGQPPKLARSSSRKVWTKPARLFDDYPSKTEAARTDFEVIPGCIYGSKYMGSTEHGMDCDCTEEWGRLLSLYYALQFTHSDMQTVSQKRTLLVERIRTASTVRQRLSVLEIAGVDPNARTSASKNASMQKSQSFKQRRKVMACEQILT